MLVHVTLHGGATHSLDLSRTAQVRASPVQLCFKVIPKLFGREEFLLHPECEAVHVVRQLLCFHAGLPCSPPPAVVGQFGTYDRAQGGRQGCVGSRAKTSTGSDQSGADGGVLVALRGQTKEAPVGCLGAPCPAEPSALPSIKSGLPPTASLEPAAAPRTSDPVRRLATRPPGLSRPCCQQHGSNTNRRPTCMVLDLPPPPPVPTLSADEGQQTSFGPPRDNPLVNVEHRRRLLSVQQSATSTRRTSRSRLNMAALDCGPLDALLELTGRAVRDHSELETAATSIIRERAD